MKNMGGRGSSSINSRERAEGVMNAMRDAGLTPRVSVEEVERNINSQPQRQVTVSDVMHTSYVNDYQRGFNRTASAQAKAGYREEKNSLMAQIQKNPRAIERITQKAQDKYRRQLENIERQMGNSIGREYERLQNQREKTYGKFQAANFINWSRK